MQKKKKIVSKDKEERDARAAREREEKKRGSLKACQIHGRSSGEPESQYRR